jgi:sugar (glycoside-pentoside-hexuronide) transporter
MSSWTRPQDEAPLPVSTLALYGLPGMSVNFLFSLVLILYMKFGTDVLGVSPGVLGAIFFVSRVWDAVSDPVAGNLSDRTRGPLGRRKSWLLASSIPLALSAVAMWSPPASLSGAWLTGWIAVSVFAFYTAYTLFEVPHMALGAELTGDPRSRIRVFGARQILRTLGLFLAGAVGAALLESPANPRAVALGLAAAAGAVGVLTVVISVAWLPRERPDHIGRGGEHLFRALADVWRNKHARLLLFVFFLESMGAGGIGVLAPYVLTYVMKMPDLLNEMLIGYMVPALLSIPVWVRLGNHFEKRRLWQVALAMNAVGFGALFFVSEGSVALVMAAAVVAGTAGGCGSTLGQALKADVVDVDELATGERKEGAYFAAWNFVGKLASGVMMGLVGVSLQAVGYVENQDQSELTQFTMRFLMGGMPFVGFGIALVAFSRFSLSEADHARVREQIASRRR